MEAPRPPAPASDGGEHARFWGAIADRYDAIVDRQIGGRTRQLVAERLGKETALGRLVELGCGTGFYTGVLAGRAERVVATDVAPGMLELARRRVDAANVSFQVEDCQRTSFDDASFDAAFIGLVLQFTEPDQALREMHRILKPGGTLLVANVDPGALGRIDRVRALVRMVFFGVTGYRVRPPRGFGRNMLTAQQLRERLHASGFVVLASETLRDPSSSSHIPVEYVCARRRGG